MSSSDVLASLRAHTVVNATVRVEIEAPHQPELSNSIYDPQFAGSSSIFNPEKEFEGYGRWAFDDGSIGTEDRKIRHGFVGCWTSDAGRRMIPMAITQVKCERIVRESPVHMEIEEEALMHPTFEEACGMHSTKYISDDAVDRVQKIRHWKKIKKDERSQWTELWRRMVALQKKQLEDGIVNCRRC
ncbi:Protein CBG25710 [Caenorhabditis briggsae]|uniref:Protein CBG25710 n=1 Tax=Caenorhabditis briggsae TaxID=6238 RepID=B6IGX3_CAEBR|nr:Protein CBG25710 [Caenorhabditis briggsae]CAR99153.1 Protein CBG25710 [Caenorhabditis briggsae]